MNRIALILRLSLVLVAWSAATVLTVVAQDNEVVVEAVEAVDEDPGEDVEVAVAEEELEWAVAVADDKTLKLRATVQVERALLRRACDLTADQEKELEQLNDGWVDKILEETGDQAVELVQPGLIMRFFGANRRPAPKRDPRATLERELKQQVDQLLTAEQKLRYEAETRSRDQYRAEATAAAIVETFYERLGLTDEQAKEIEKSIQSWAGKTNIRMLVYFSNTQYYPDVPEHLLRPHLTAEQLILYAGLSRHLFTDENFNDGQAPIIIER